MLGNDIADVLSSGGIGAVGGSTGTIFVGQIPATLPLAAACVVGIVETGGLASVHTFSTGPGLAKVERPRFQVMTRSCVYATARAVMQDCFNLLDGLKSRTINGVFYHWVSSVQSPFALGLDANNQWRFAVNFDCVKAISTSTST